MSEIIKRTATGTVFIAVFVGAILGGVIPFYFFLLLINVIGVWEYIRIFKQDKDLVPSAFLTYVVSIFTFSLLSIKAVYEMMPGEYYYLLIPLLFLFLLIEIFSGGDAPFQRAGISILGVLYVSVPLACLVHLSVINGVYDSQIVIGSLILIWANDTFAFIVGKSIGKTPLLPSVSPKKTWEGSIGGAAGSIASAVVLNYFFQCFTLAEWLVMSAVFVVFGSLGDLLESRLKRSFDIKDSGTLLPGHGGILDRFDAILFSVPFALAAIQLMRVLMN